MNNYRELPVRYLKVKKARYFSIVIGIVISVALITGIFTIMDSIKGRIIETYEKYGKSYSSIYNIPGEEIPKITNNAKLEKSGFSTVLGRVNFEDIAGKSTILTADSIENLYLESLDNIITNGKLPTKPGELIVSEVYLQKINKNIGDEVTIEYYDVFDNNKIKEITGNVVATSKENYNIFIIDKTSIEKDRGYTLLLKYKDVKDTMESAEELKSKYNIRDIKDKKNEEEDSAFIEVNKSYVSLLGEKIGEIEEAETLAITNFVLILFVVIVSIGLIYNGFIISINERNKEFSLLRAVGISKKQLRKIVLKEATIVGTIGIALGVIAGIVLSYLILSLICRIDMIDIGAIKFKVSSISIVLSIVVSILTIALSLIIPIAKISKVSPVDGMKNKYIDYKNIKLEKGIVLLGRLYNGPKIMADKNLRRNRGRYRAVVFGFSLSIFMFITFNAYEQMSDKAMEIVLGDIKPGIDLYIDSNLEKIKNLDGIKHIYEVKELSSLNTENITVFPMQEASKLNNLTDEFKSKTTKKYYYIIQNIDENILKEEILKDKNLDVNKLKKGIVIQNNTLIYDGKKGIPIKITNYKVGDKVDLNIVYSKTNPATKEMEDKVYTLKDVEIAGFDESLTVESQNSDVDINFYMGEELFKKVLEDTQSEGWMIYNVIIAESLKKEKEIYRELNDNQSKYNIGFIYSMSQDNLRYQEQKLAFKIGVYSFLVFMTLLTLINIITSITANIESRRKEIALLRAVGTSKTFIKKMIYKENISYYISSMIIGVTFGLVASKVLSIIGSSMYEGIYIFPLKSIIVVGVILYILIIILNKYSLNKLCSNNIVEELREE